MNGALLCDEIRADAKAEWQRARAKLETMTRFGNSGAAYILEMRIRAEEREKAYRRIDMILKKNGIPERE